MISSIKSSAGLFIRSRLSKALSPLLELTTFGEGADIAKVLSSDLANEHVEVVDMRNVAFVLVWILGSAVTTLAQDRQSRIVDLSGNGVPNVEIASSVRCLNAAGFPIMATTSILTDAEGRFVWPESVLTLTLGCMSNSVYSYELKKEGFVFTRKKFRHVPVAFSGTPGQDNRLAQIQATDLPAWSSVSAATFEFSQQLAGEMIVTGFGPGLAERVEVAQLPLPTRLADRRVLVRDQAGAEKFANLLFVSPTQINYIMPNGLATGPAVIRLVDANANLIRIGLTEITRGAPGIFTANSNGAGVPAAILTRVRPGNMQNIETVYRFDEMLQRFVPAPIDLGAEEEFLVISLFGTGWRQLPANEVRVFVSNVLSFVECPVEFVGKHPALEGLDQINARLPRSLIGKGDQFVYVEFQGGLLVTNQALLNFK
jgi:uncharacterized protein (TIGR03437 family)